MAPFPGTGRTAGSHALMRAGFGRRIVVEEMKV